MLLNVLLKSDVVVVDGGWGDISLVVTDATFVAFSTVSAALVPNEVWLKQQRDVKFWLEVGLFKN